MDAAGIEGPLCFEPLGLAVKDATAFAASMKKAAAGLYDEVRVTLALDQDATRDNLRKIVDKLAAEIHPRDTFILFAAAHGTSENGRFYLIPQDYQSGRSGPPRQRAIGQDDLQDWLANRIKARKAIILLDTCEIRRAGRRPRALAHRRAGLRGRASGGCTRRPAARC